MRPSIGQCSDHLVGRMATRQCCDPLALRCMLAAVPSRDGAQQELINYFIRCGVDGTLYGLCHGGLHAKCHGTLHGGCHGTYLRQLHKLHVPCAQLPIAVHSPHEQLPLLPHTGITAGPTSCLPMQCIGTPPCITYRWLSSSEILYYIHLIQSCCEASACGHCL